MRHELIQWFQDLFTSFQVVYVHDYPNMEEASRKGCHAAIWGFLELNRVNERVSKIGERQVLGIRVTVPRALNKPTRYQKAKLRRFFRDIGFIWDGSMIVFDQQHGCGLTTHINIGNYNQKG